MTLILSNMSKAFVLQTSDRLLTKTTSNKDPVKFDPIANKTIVYWARDAIVCMSYTGAAYVGQLPTDSWIVQKLTGVDVSQKFDLKFGPLPQWLDIGQATELLTKEFSQSEIARQSPSFQLVIVGWQWKRRNRPMAGRLLPVPMAWGISKDTDKGFEAEVERLPRYWHWKHKNFFCATPKQNFPKDKQLETCSRFDTEFKRDPIPQTDVEIANRIERVTADVIHEVSDSNPYVGPNSMSVLIAPPNQTALVRVTFFPHEQHTARVIGNQDTSPAFPAAYTPWIVGQGVMHKPSVQIGKGSSDVHMGPFLIKLPVPSDGPDSGLIAAMSSQQRPPRPTS